MKTTPFSVVLVTAIFLCISCSSDETSNTTDDDASTSTANLIIKLDVDPSQARLGNTGQPTEIPSGHAGQDPNFNTISAHYLELSPSATTLLGQGEILYNAPETESGGNLAINFEQAIVVTPGEVFLTIPLDEIATGNYEWVRLSLSYQNYDIDFAFNGLPLTGTVASFVGFDTYLQSYTIKNEVVTVNENRRQGYWGFETNGIVQTGLAPEGATTVPNPLFDSSPIPAGSCVVTGNFASNLVITGDETEDITVTLSLSTNKSFEWIDTNGNNTWNVTTLEAEPIIDVGLLKLLPSHNNEYMSQPNNPLHGVKLADILEFLSEKYGWQELSYQVDINCFKKDPSVKSSLKFLRKTPWAREKVEQLYLQSIDLKKE